MDIYEETVWPLQNLTKFADNLHCNIITAVTPGSHDYLDLAGVGGHHSLGQDFENQLSYLYLETAQINSPRNNKSSLKKTATKG